MLPSFHSFLDFHGKVALVYTMTNLLDFPMIFIGYILYSEPQFFLNWREFHNFLAVWH